MDNNEPKNKKKLPTGPINIQTNFFPPGKTEESNQSKPKPETASEQKQDFVKEELLTPDSEREKESRLELSDQSKKEIKKPEENLAFQKQDFREQDFKKVAMRLSPEAATKLKQLREETKLPYEVLVDVMIRNWDELPKPFKKDYLEQAKQVRAQRLIAGQIKTVKSLQEKYKQS